MKKVICLIAIFSLIYSNCLYAIGVDTLAGVSPLTSPEFAEDVRKLGHIFDITDGETNRIVYDSRNLFARLLRDEPDGISVFLNKGLKEVFVFSKNGLVHIYRDSHTQTPARPLQRYDISNIKIDIYQFTPDLIDFLKGIKDFVLIEGVPSPDYKDSGRREIIERHIGGFEDLKGVLPESLRRYLLALTSAVYAKVPDGLKGELRKDGIPGLKKGGEAENAVRIRDYIINNGRRLDIGPDYSWINFMGWDGNNGEDKDLNAIIERNVKHLFSRLPDEEREVLLHSLNKHLRGEIISISIPDSSRHWLENCRGDRFMGINRALLIKIVEALKELADEMNGKNRPDEVARIENSLYALETYLQTYIYHELRHEAFIEERRLLGERVYEVEDMGFSDLQNLIERFSEAGRKEFDAELERRQNGSDARYFVNASGVKYEEFLQCLLEMEMLDMDSLFLHASAICGFSLEVPIGDGAHKHYNELITDDFSGIPRDKLARRVYKNYEAEYTEMYRKDKDGTELRYRGRISYLLYKIGLNDYIRVDTWKKESGYDRDLAKEYIVRLIDFMSRYERYLKFLPGRGEISMFRKRERPLLYRDAAQLLLVSLLSSGDYSQAIQRTELGFKTSGIVNTVTGNKFEFWKLIEEACEAQFNKGDMRFKGITAEAMRSASIEKEMIPRLRIVILFWKYLGNLPLSKFSNPYREIFHSLYLKYRQYSDGKKAGFDNADLGDFDKLYKKVSKLLADEFEVDVKDDDDLLLALWDAFELVENLADASNFQFTEPLFVNGTKGDETRFEPQEIDEITELKKVFDKKDRIEWTDIKAGTTKRRVQLIWSIYKTKVLRYREGLCNILNRYGTDRDISGNRVWDLLRKTRGWSSAVWLAREYSKLFGEGIIKESLDLDAGLSVFYYALSKIYGIEPGRLSGLKDVISDPTAEYFGINPDRLAGDFSDGGLVDMKTGNTVETEPESYDLILSIYRLHTVTSPQKLYNIFRNVHRALKYGGHFAITLPYGRVFGEESLRVLREKLGFEPVISPGITWNELSEDSRKGIVARFGEDEAKRIERELFKRRFYVIILKKTGVIKEGEEELKDKFLLLPEVLTDKEIGKPIMPEVRVPEEEEEEEKTREISIDETGWASAGVLDGITFSDGEVAGKLKEGLGESRKIKERAENIGVISEYQDMIKGLLEEVVVPPELRLKDFVKEEIRERIDKALKYSDSDYTTSVEAELFGLVDKLEGLKKFIKENYEEFMKKLEEIKKKVEFFNYLADEDKEKFNRIIGYKITDLNENTLEEVRDIYTKLEKTAKKKEEEDRFIKENWERFQELQRLLKRYRAIGESAGQGRIIKEVLKIGAKQDLTQRVMSAAESADKRIAEIFSSKKRGFSSLKELDSEINELFKWIDCEFLFSFIDIKFLSSLKIEWEKDELSREWQRHVERLHVFMDVLGDWRILKELIDWKKGLAALLKDKPEKEYMRRLDYELLYKPFLAGRGIEGRVLDITPLTTGEEIISECGNTQIGGDLVISVSDLLSITDDFLGGLEKLGLEIRNIYEAWLEADGLEGSMRRGKRIIVVRKIKEPADVDANSLNLQMEREDTQNYSNFVNIREKLLQDLGPSDFHINTRELLSKKQIINMYPDWAKIYLGKGEWVGIIFDKEKVRKAVEDYEEGERKRREREDRLIKRLEMPFVKITYDETWTESLVRDLAQILLRLIGDFSNPNPQDVVNHPFITGHPQLGTIPRDEVINKIEELIRYRQYDLKIERLYREFTRLTGVFFHMGICKLNVTADIDGIKRTIPMIDKDDADKILRWHEYTIGADPSPFGRSPEEWYNIITGNLLALRRLEPSRILEAPVEGRRLVIHCLSGQEGFFRKLAGGFKGVEIAAGDGSFKSFFELLSSLYQNKNFGEKYIEEIADLAYLQLVYFLSKVQSGSLESTEVREITGFFTQNTERLLSGEMTIDEYNDFVSRLKQRLDISGLPGQEIEAANQAQKSFYYYIHGDGQEKEIMVTKDDIILSKYADGLARAKYYFDAMHLLRSVRLYILSGVEKKILDELISDMLSGDASSINKIISYLKADNTINRYLYFSFIYLSRIWAQESLDQMAGWHNNITREILKIEPMLTAYTVDASNMNIISLLTELYRLKQMLEDVSLGSARIEIQLSVNRLITILWDKTTDRQLLRELNRMTEKVLDTKALMECDLAFIGNPYHTDLTKKAIIGLEYLRDYDRFTMLAVFEVDVNEEDVKKMIEGIVEELRILFIYHPNETQTALENTAWAVARSSWNQNVRYFMEVFRRHNPDEYKELERLIKNAGKSAGKDLSYREIVRLLKIATESFDFDSKELKNAIKKSQWLRYTLLGIINNIGLSGLYKFQCNRFVELIFQSVENPYEIYNIFKKLITEPVHATNPKQIYGYIMIKGIEKMEEFIKDNRWEKGIINILTCTYNQFLLMKDVISIGLDTSDAFRKFIAELFCGENGIVSGYAYEYIASYLKDIREGKIELVPGVDRIRNIHEIFLYIIAGLLRNGDDIDSVRFRRMLELFAYSVTHIPGVKLDEEWADIIGRYKSGQISKDTLLRIWRNANWMIEDTCGELDDESKVQDVRNRYGMHIFEESAGDAYFGEMKQEEINPQIKRILEDPEEKDFYFVKGESVEGKKGRMAVSAGVLDLINEILKSHPELDEYDAVVLRGVNFSGHYGRTRKRIYIPVEIPELTSDISLLASILEDLIEHEYMHTQINPATAIYYTEEEIIANSERKRPGVYEKARDLYRKYIAGRLADTVKGAKGAEILKDKIDRILRRVQEGKRIELSEVELHRLLWLIDRSREINIVPEIARLIDLILEPDYAGDPGQVVMAVEKAILAHLYTEEQLHRQDVLNMIEELKTSEEKNRVSVYRTHAGLRFEGKELPHKVKNIINYIYRFQPPSPAFAEGVHYVLIDEYRAERYADVIKHVSEKWGVRFITEIPEDVNKDEIVVLVDPEDTGEYKGFLWYLPLIYCEKSFELAAWLSINKPDKLIGTPVYEFVKTVYEELLGEELNDEDVISWFKKPWELKDRISNLSENLKLLRIAFKQLDISA